MAETLTFEDKNFLKDNWKDGLISGLEQRIESLEMGNSVMGQRLKATDDAVTELQGYVAMQTPFTDGFTKQADNGYEACGYLNCQEDRDDLTDTLKVALNGLKPGATVTQQNIAYYAVRGILSTEIDD